MPAWTWLFPILAAALALPGAILTARALLRDRPRGRLRCPKCWYDMTGVPTSGAGARTCPECGRTSKHDRHLRRTRRHWRPALLGLALLALAALTLGGADAIRHGWPGAVPAPVLRLVLSIFEADGEDLYTRSRGWPNAASLTRWERLLLAHHCARILDDDLSPSSRAAAPAMMYDFAVFMHLQALKADARPAVPSLVHHLRTAGESRRTQCAATLGAIGGTSARRALRRALREDGAATVRLAALASLATIETPRRARRLLLACLGDRDDALRAAAATHLGSLKEKAADAAPAIARSIDPVESTTHLRAITRALAQIDPEGIEHLGQLLHHDRPPVRAAAAFALNLSSVTNTRPVIDDLIAALSDTEPDVRGPVAQILERCGPPASRAVSRLLEVAASDPQMLVRYTSLRAIARLAPGDPAAALALGRALSDPDVGVRHLAARELELFGPAAAPARAALLTAQSTDPDGLVREAAADALRAIHGAPQGLDGPAPGGAD